MAITTTIKMYNQRNLGDCFLLKITPEKGEESFILIDFGSYTSNRERERIIAQDIKKTVKGKKLTIVLTHQHRDHISGFGTSEDILTGLGSELWLSFLDNEASPEGKVLRDLTEKYWKKSKKINQHLAEMGRENEQVRRMYQAKRSLDLFAEEQIGGSEMTSLLSIVGNKVRFLTPGDSFFVPGTDQGLKAYVLGPPRKLEQLKKLNPKHDEEVSGLDLALELANLDIASGLMLDALDSAHGYQSSAEANFPFNKRYQSSASEGAERIRNLYEQEPGRKIDQDWLGEMGRLALHMDNLTNNTSLVLAFELVESKKVLLFVGDAQIGNWQSWFDVKFSDPGVDARDLLSRTVVYKAGHHSSHNATLKQGLELMTRKDLTILIPVDGAVSERQGFAMLKKEMLLGYNRQAKGNVFRSDTIEQPKLQQQTEFDFAESKNVPNLKVNPDPNGGHLSIELTISDNDTGTIKHRPARPAPPRRPKTSDEQMTAIVETITKGTTRAIPVKRAVLKRKAK